MSKNISCLAHPVLLQIKTSLVNKLMEGQFKAVPDSLLTQFLLAFLATAGIFFVNIMAALVDGLIEALAFTTQQAGMVASVNVYGSALGALAAVFIVKRLAWKPLSFVLLILLMVIDTCSIALSDFEVMVAARAIHGVVGGLLVGVGISEIARTHNADKSFGILMLLQFGLGGVGLAILPGLVPSYGTSVLFIALIVFSAVTLLMLPFLPSYPEKNTTEISVHKRSKPYFRVQLLLALFATFLFQGSLMGCLAYMFGLGVDAGLEKSFVAWILGGASWMGAVGALMMVLVPTRLGRVFPLMLASIIAVVAMWALHFSANKPIFVLVSFSICLSWAFVTPYLFGMCSDFAATGSMAAMAGFASKMGLATGPMIGAVILTNNNYSLLINAAAIGVAASLLVGLLPAIILDKRLVRSN